MVYEAAPESWRLDSVWVLDTAPGGPLRALHTGSFMTLSGDGWLDRPVPAVPFRRPGGCVGAAPDGVVRLDDEGALYYVHDNGETRQLKARSGSVSGERLVWDATADRAVLWDGWSDTAWVSGGRRWRKLRPGSDSGEAVLCGTPRGVYLLHGRQLWLLDGDEWRSVGRAGPGWRGNAMWWSPTLGGLWILTDEAIDLWTDDGPRTVATPTLPALRRGDHFEDTWRYQVCTGYDPLSNTLLWHMERYAVKPDSPDLTRAEELKLRHRGFAVRRPTVRTMLLRLDDLALPSASLPEPRGNWTAAP